MPATTIENRQEVESAVDSYIQELAEQVVLEAQNLVPVKTGRLKNSIQVMGEGEAGSDVEYALAVELGDGERPASPFLRPALRKVLSNV